MGLGGGEGGRQTRENVCVCEGEMGHSGRNEGGRWPFGGSPGRREGDRLAGKPANRPSTGRHRVAARWSFRGAPARRSHGRGDGQNGRGRVGRPD